MKNADERQGSNGRQNTSGTQVEERPKNRASSGDGVEGGEESELRGGENRGWRRGGRESRESRMIRGASGLGKKAWECRVGSRGSANTRSVCCWRISAG